VHDDYQRMGVAQALYTALIRILKLQGFRNLYAVINLPTTKAYLFMRNQGLNILLLLKTLDINWADGKMWAGGSCN
jgi:ribosomal protein S18 acetylase RimI-like enzyme